MRGIESTAMILSTESHPAPDGSIRVDTLMPPSSAVPGDIVTLGADGARAGGWLKSKAWEEARKGLGIGKSLAATWDGRHVLTVAGGKGVCGAREEVFINGLIK